jgi:hypothetical protein
MKVKFGARPRERGRELCRSHPQDIFRQQSGITLPVMLHAVTRLPRRVRAWSAAVLVAGGLLAMPGPASARVWVGFGFPLFVGPPAYYPPPVYYPPPAYYPPPVYYSRPPAYYYAPPPPPPGSGYVAPRYSSSGQSCIAGATLCPMERPTASGSACYCTTMTGRVWGRAS